MDEQLLALAEQSAKNDLAFLIKAKEEAKKRMKDDPSPENIKAFERAKSAVESEAARLQAAPVSARVYKTQLDAVAFLKGSGFKVAKSKFNADVKRGKVPRNSEGHFEEGALLGYAAANLTPLSSVEDRAASEAMVNRMSADAELKQFQAQRQKLKLEREQGLLMPRADHERDLAVRAQLFRNEIEGRDRRTAPKLVELVVSRLAALDGVPPEVAGQLRDAAPNLVPEVTEFLLRDSGDLMDAWSSDRAFVVELADEPAGDAA
ncbi:hypothetical protein NNJEOMEG_03329 [Fundidesulfovibrio magnetotacticus]|uniref:Uncharacterized protein n=1 Tax=Fundidesulfovibrio magnetotacticus TaxID=2730080 RepID=A0A6V8M0A7_9BACT|nr:hypothetical protein [Fundidesulfovibrio magnetotacticus]GFK95466.1 hypothetical protein NNJEOMEG_03329 [Fundidesulfovibrio magnetotacticus]